MSGASELIDYLMRVENLIVVAAVWTLISVLARIFPRLKSHPVWARAAPAAPMVLCSIAVWIPGTVNGDIGIGSRIFLGIILGALVANGHKIFGQTVLGNDARIKNGKRSADPLTDPTTGKPWDTSSSRK